MSLVPLEPPPGPELVAERIIYVRLTCSRGSVRAGGAKYRDREPVLERVARTLREFRARGLEVELYLRGSWTHRARGLPRRFFVLEDCRLNGWRLTASGIQLFDPSLPAGVQWEPFPKREPRPAIVVRGVTRSDLRDRSDPLDQAGIG